MKKLALITAALLASASAVPASAATIIYTISGNFTGTAAGQSFNNVKGTFTGVGDTSTATTGAFGIPSYVAVNLSTFTAFTPVYNLSAAITSSGTFGIYGPSTLGNTVTRLGFIFNNSGSNGIALESSAFDNYSGLTSLATTGGNVYYQNASFDTAYGQVNITGFTNATFSASAVPEPATWAMMLAGFGMIGFGLRSRRSQTVRVTYA